MRRVRNRYIVNPRRVSFVESRDYYPHAVGSSSRRGRMHTLTQPIIAKLLDALARQQSQEVSQRRTYAYLPSAWLALQIKKKNSPSSRPIKTRTPPNKICLSLAGPHICGGAQRNGMLGNSLLDGSKRTYCAHICCARSNHYINQTDTKPLTLSIEYSPTTLCPFPFTLHIFQVIFFRFSVCTQLHIPCCHEKSHCNA